MSVKNKAAKKKVLIRSVAVFVVAAGIFFIDRIVQSIDSQMRAELLRQTQLMARAIDSEDIQALSGTAEDMAKPEYAELRAQLKAMVQSERLIQYVYLMGRAPDRTVFFYLDVVGNSSEYDEPSLPGDPYAAASDQLRQSFDTARPFVEGPIADEWGEWVSALVPILTPEENITRAVLGVDIAARDWRWALVARSAVPVGLLCTLLILIVTLLMVKHPVDVRARPILSQLLPPLSVMVVVLFALAGAILWWQHAAEMRAKTAFLSSTIAAEIQVDLRNQADGLHHLLHSLTMDKRIQAALREEDAARLLSDWSALYKTLKRDYGLTHFYFINSQRVCLLRVHKPNKKGDRIDRFTALEAEHTGQPASGIELGPLGTFTLRVIHPVFQDGRLLGYIELGKEIEDILTERHMQSHSHVALTIYKKYLERAAWEKGMRFLGREADWERLPDSVVIYASQGRLPDPFARMAVQEHAGRSHAGTMDRDIAFEGKVWRTSIMPFKDVSGTVVGDLLVMKDISGERNAFLQTIIIGAVVVVVLLFAFLSFVFLLLRKTDSAILSQQAELLSLNHQLRAANQQLAAGEQQLRAANQQLQANEQQLRAANQALRAREQQLMAGETELKKKMRELQLLNDLMSERELRVIDIKKEVNALLRAQGRPEKYSQGLD